MLAVAVYSAGVGFLPLFAGPSYEAALAAGLVYPSIVAVAVALHTANARLLPSAALAWGLSTGAVAATVGYGVFLLHGLRAGLCEPLAESALFLLGPWVGTLLAGAWGATAGVLVTLIPGHARRAGVAGMLALAGPLACVAVSVWRYYTSPMIFAFDPFVGYFAGTLYDTVIDGVPRLLTYRMGSAASLIAISVVAGAFVRRADGTYSFDVSRRPALSTVGAVAIVGSIVITMEGPSLGHYQTTGSIRAVLGRTAKSERCEVVYALGIRTVHAHALARECDAHVRQIEKYLDVEAPRTVTAFVFADADQKARLMGARDTYIAKPWRNEVYVQYRPFPHPVLGHELVHVIAGTFGQGPFRVSGPAGGWIPDPGRIEGIAVAAAPRDDDDLSLVEWAAAMKKLEVLPELRNVFRLGFLGENSSSAYTVAGAFVSWLEEHHGIEAVRKWYSGQSLEAATGHGLAQLERHFLHVLDTVKVSDAALEVARARFDRPAVFGRRCPHSVDRLLEEAQAMLAGFDAVRAEALYRQVLDLDPANFAARRELAMCAIAGGDVEAGRKQLEALAADTSLTGATAASVEEALGDLALRQGKAAAALSHYDAAKKNLVSDAHLRALDIKRLAASSKYRNAIVELLAPDPAVGTDWGAAASALAAWSEADDDDGLADYLLGKNFFARGRWKLAAAHLDRALERKIALRRVRREAARSRILVACALGEKGRVRQLAEQFEKLGGGVERQAAVRRIAERCTLGWGEGDDGATSKESKP